MLSTDARRQVGVCPMCGPTVFFISGSWMRDHHRCGRCGSIPRMRQVVLVLEQALPEWRQLSVFEANPAGPASDFIAAGCSDYVSSQYAQGVRSGSVENGVRVEDLHALSLPSSSVDIVITQDVFEHVLDPDTAWREVARVLKPGGAHVWTVPVYAGKPTLARAVPDGEGGLVELMPPEYHDDGGGGPSLVIHEWGDDVASRCDASSGTQTTRYTGASELYGVVGAMRDVFVSWRPAGASPG